MGVIDRVSGLVTPVIEGFDLALYDVEQAGGTLRISVSGSDGVGIDALARLTRAISSVLDEADPVSGSYTLEVTSPGLERKLRLPWHFADAIGTDVTVKTLPPFEPRRLRGTLVAADEESITVRDAELVEHQVAHGDIQTARTAFEWGPTPKSGGPQKKTRSSSPSGSDRPAAERRPR